MTDDESKLVDYLQIISPLILLSYYENSRFGEKKKNIAFF